MTNNESCPENLDTAAKILWQGTEVGSLSKLKCDEVYFDGDFHPNDAAGQVGFLDLISGISSEQIMKQLSGGVHVDIIFPDPKDSRRNLRIIAYLDGNLLMRLQQ